MTENSFDKKNAAALVLKEEIEELNAWAKDAFAFAKIIDDHFFNESSDTKGRDRKSFAALSARLREELSELRDVASLLLWFSDKGAETAERAAAIEKEGQEYDELG